MALEQVATSYWLLARMTESEQRIYRREALTYEEKLPLLDRVSAQRARLERSLANGLRQLQQLQKVRQEVSQRPQTVQPKPIRPAEQPTVPHPEYEVPGGAEAYPLVCAPASPDTR